MPRLDSLASKAAVFGVLALLAVLIALAPWKTLILKYSEYETGKYRLGRAASDRPAQPPPAATWRIEPHYSPADGTLELRLGHQRGAPIDNLNLHAEFSDDPLGAAAASAILHRAPGGVYRSRNVRLPKGDWLMSVTGRRRSEFVFRREEILKVE